MLVNLTLPSGLSSVSYDAFDSISTLENIFLIGENNLLKSENGIITNKANTIIYFMPTKGFPTYKIRKETTQMSYSPFRNNLELKNVTSETNTQTFVARNNLIYKSNELVTSIGGLEEANISGCTSIAPNAFDGTLVKKVIFLDNMIKTISNQVFMNTLYLESITFSDSITSIGDWGLSKSGISEIIFPAGLNSVGQYMLSVSKVEKISFKKCTKLIKFTQYTFQMCYNLKSIELPPNIETIDTFSFQECTNLTSISIPPKVTLFQMSAFQKSGISNIIFESNNNASRELDLGDSTFKECPIVSITIPDYVIRIGKQTFGGCSLLKSIIIKPSSKLRTIDEDAFANTIVEGNFFIGNQLQTISPGALSQMLKCTGFTTESSNYTANGGLVFNKNKSQIIACPGGLSVVNIPDSVKSFFSFAFYKCSNLEDIIFSPNSQLNSIGMSTFYGCTAISTISFPVYLETIEESAFKECTSLTNIKFPTASNLKTIGASAFSGCSKLGDLLMPKSLKKIGSSAFANCKKIQSFEASNLESIGELAFSNCFDLQTVKICVPKWLSAYDESAFNGCSDDLIVNVPIDYDKGTLCGRNVVKALDKDCFLPTVVFTISGGSKHIGTVLIAVLIFSDSREDK